MSRSLLERYRSGDEAGVWRVIHSAPGGKDWPPEAEEVVGEATARMARNLERIVEHLSKSGYLFGVDGDFSTDPARAWHSPTKQSRDALTLLTKRFGGLPLVLSAWWSEIGAVSLAGYFPDIESPDSIPYADALVFFGAEDVAAEIVEMQASGDYPKKPPYTIDLAPDVFHKAGVSGGAPYSITVPDASVDVLLANVLLLTASPVPRTPWIEIETNETLLEYLRRSFLWAGFPGLAFQPAARTAKLLPLLDHLEPI